ncbi:hypothetical protein XMIN_2678 [Xanthomonas citri pv. mangiferaeindicae LMG 941]|nr:hypothetical protein XMIN_2678 [Xanthomonas citri pv. mangiferaeindicae LMG 941]
MRGSCNCWARHHRRRLDQRQHSLFRSHRRGAISVGLHGPRGKGSVQVDATRRQGRWTYRTLTFASIDGARIDVLPAATSSPPPRRP